MVSVMTTWMPRWVVGLAVTMAAGVQRLMACPSCSDNFTGGSGNASVGELFSWSVLFMLAVPMTIVAAFTIVIRRRLRSAEEAP